MKRFLNFVFALLFFALGILAFICAKEDAEHSILLWLIGVFFGLFGVRFLCRD